jgi:tRNA(adenine34) deaminase
LRITNGELAERSNAAASKVVVGASSPEVRILHSPPCEFMDSKQMSAERIPRNLSEFCVMKNHEHYMREALKEAVKAFENDEVPVGAIIVHEGEIIGRAHNQIKTLKDPTAHAEIIAITQAANFLQSERLTNCSMYSTLEPCSMCAGAMVLSRIKDLVYAAKDPKTGAHDSVFKILNNKKLNHRIKVKKGILENEASSLMKEFFYGKRKSKT